ncbi:Heat shock 70 kDa protein 17 [Picochlorum sp. SENEW3]|nr:Heat shock 70 kDa protein 17 [Picochlorum sp. SENEW3]
MDRRIVFRAFVLLCIATQALGALMAIDLGSENLKISIVKPGKIPISIVINEMSKRKTPAALSIVDGDRLVGEEAAALSARYPDKVFTGFRDMLGKAFGDEVVVEDLKRLRVPFELEQAANRSTIAVKTDQGTSLSAEEAVASLFEYAAKLAKESADGVPVTDCVIVVPAYFTPGQRRAIKDAASLANLNVLTLVNSHAAAALQYGIERDFTNKTEQVIFYDLGAKSAEVALVEFSSFVDKTNGKPVSQFDVKDVAWVSHNVGGDALEVVLVDMMIGKFEGDSQNLLSNKRAIAKLRKQAQKAKKVLSANTEVNVSIEDLVPDTDFKAHITREEFEVAASKIVDRAVIPLKAILSRNNVTSDDLSAVELLGGSSRVPLVKSRLSEALNGRALDSHLDADEAVVLGAGLVAANLSTIFRLRKFGMTDKSMYDVTFSLNGDESRVLAPVMKKIPTHRAIKQDNVTDDAFSVSFEWNNELGAQDGATRAPLGSVRVSGISDVVKNRGYSGNVSLHTSIDSSGIFHVDKADTSVEIEVEQKIPIVSNSTAELNTTSTVNETSSSNSTDESPKAIEPQFEVKMVKRKAKDPLQMNVTFQLNSMTTEHMISSRKVLREFRERDRVKRETDKARNDLEAFIIDMSSSIQDEDSKLYTFSTEEERQKASKDLMDAEDWIYGDEAEIATASTFKSKLASIRSTIDSIEHRIDEAARRDKVIQTVTSFVDDSAKTIKSWAKSKPWITKEETEALQKNMTELVDWMKEQQALQEKKPVNEDPIFKADNVLSRLDQARKAFTRLNIKSKPIEKPVKLSKKAEEETKENTTEEQPAADTEKDTSDDDNKDSAQQEEKPDHSEL